MPILGTYDNVARYNFPAYYIDSSFPETLITLTETDSGDPIVLTDAEIKLTIRKESVKGSTVQELTLSSGLTAIDLAAGQFKINEQILKIKENVIHWYDLQVKFPNDSVMPYLYGSMMAYQNVGSFS
jgi:hypothetical protein